MRPSGALSIPDFRDEFHRRVAVRALWLVPHRPLRDLVDLITGDSPHATALQSLTLAEVQEQSIEAQQRAVAVRLVGDDFDQIVLAIVALAREWVKCGYVMARAGGPRWKVQHALVRLADAGELERRGKTSATEYRVGRPWS